MEMYDDYGQPDVFSNLTNPEHALQSPTALLLSAGQNVFMYEQDHNPPTIKQEYFPKACQHSDNIFEFPNPTEMAELGCSPVDTCWPETPLLAASLDGSLNDSGMYFGWELSDEEQETQQALPGEGELFSCAPTLAELNMDDSQSRDATGQGLKRKLEVEEVKVKEEEEKKPIHPHLTRLLCQQEMSLSPQSWKRVKTKVLEMGRKNDSPSPHPLPKVTNVRQSASKKSARTKASKPGVGKAVRTNGEAVKNRPKAGKLAKLNLGKLHFSEIDFTEIFWKRYREKSIPSPTKEMSRSEFIARTPNPFGNRRFLGKNALLRAKSHPATAAKDEASKTVAPPAKLPTAKLSSRSAPVKIPHKGKARRPSAPAIAKKHPVSMETDDESSQEKLWKELEEFMYGEQKALRESKKNLPNRTLKRTAPDVKSETSKSPRAAYGSDPGFDSHDEGLGSENEDHDDSGSEEDDDDDDDDDHPDDVSDMSDDPGLPSTSTKCSGKSDGGRGSKRRRKVKTRRSEYDDFTPNPRKLLHIGHELNKLNMTISSLSPGNEASPDEKNHTRREKNKLASRACRLKKKAQHEANKVKLWGLAEEAKQLKGVLKSMREEITSRTSKPNASWDYSLGAKLDHVIKTKLGHMVAGHTSEFVNSVLEKTAKGVPISRLAPTLT